MISKIKIENFKSIRETEANVTPLNLLMGLNGMGKSSFLQALLILLQSEKLEDGAIDLNGSLATVGLGRDALYQFAQKEKITIGVNLDVTATHFRWELTYRSDKEKLIADVRPTKTLTKIFKKHLDRLHYIRAERIGPRDIYNASGVTVTDRKELGNLGEYAVHFLNVYGREYKVKKELLHPEGVSVDLLSQTNAWMREISPGVSLNTRLIPEVNKVILEYQFDLPHEKTNNFRPKNVGFGISYVLPVIVTLLTAKEKKIIIIENPESNIHPRGQAELGKLIALAAKAGAQVFIETHSDHILNGIRVAVKEELLNRSQVNIMYFDKTTTEKEQYTKITSVKVDLQGELSEYPKNMLDEWSNQLFKLI